MAELISKDELNQKINNLSKNWVIEDIFLKGSFVFKNFDDAFSFMKKVAIKCEDMNHHPKWTNVYNQIDVELFISMGIDIIPINKIRIGRFHNISS